MTLIELLRLMCVAAFGWNLAGVIFGKSKKRFAMICIVCIICYGLILVYSNLS